MKMCLVTPRHTYVCKSKSPRGSNDSRLSLLLHNLFLTLTFTLCRNLLQGGQNPDLVGKPNAHLVFGMQLGSGRAMGWCSASWLGGHGG